MKRDDAISRLLALVERLKALPEDTEVDIRTASTEIKQFHGKLADLADQFPE